MKKYLAAILAFTIFAGPSFAASKPHKQSHQKYDFRYHAPKYKYKAPKSHNLHAHTTRKVQSH
jgi:hypothetical protein